MNRRLVLAMALVAGLVAAALAVPLAAVTSTSTRNAFISNLTIDTMSTASVLASQPQDQWLRSVTETAERTGARVVVVDADRVLVADSALSQLDRSFDRPEVNQALLGQLASDVRPSATLGTDLRFVAAPVIQDERIVAAVRLSLPEDEVDAEVLRTQLWLALFVLAVMVAAALLAWLVARSIAAPLLRLSAVAARLPDDLSLRASETDGPPEVRSVASALNVTAQRLDGMLQRTSRVAADASHHLRTPLTGVRLRLEAIEDISTQADVRDQAAAAVSEVDRLARRIDQVLDLTRSDAGSAPLVDVEASGVVAGRAEAAAVIADEHGLALESLVEPGLHVRCAAGSVARITDELLGNAFAYARSRVVLRLALADGEVRLTVEDDGPGVGDDELDAVFTRFTRGSAAVPGGSGLGLALVRESARVSGGDARASRSPVGGLCVTVTWPAAGQAA